MLHSMTSRHRSSSTTSAFQTVRRMSLVNSLVIARNFHTLARGFLLIFNTLHIVARKIARKIARNFHSFTSDHTDLLPAVSLTILPSSRILRRMLSILFIFCLSSSWSDKTSQRRFTISCFVRLLWSFSESSRYKEIMDMQNRIGIFRIQKIILSLLRSKYLCRHSKFCEVECNFFSIITNHIRIQELQHTFLCVVSLLVHHLIRQDSQTSISPEGTNRDMKQLCQHQNNLGVHIFKEFPIHYYKI